MITLGSLCLHAAQLMKGENKSIIGLKKVDDHVQFGLINKKENEHTFQTEHHLVPMLSVDVKSSIENDAAKVGVTQVYKNTTTEIMDIYYCLSINADGGSFVYFKADVDGVNVKDVSKLTVNDDDFENSGVSTGILEFFKWLGKGNHPGVYQIQICSLNPESSVQIRLGYEYKLIQQDNKLRFFIPRTIVPKSSLLPVIADDQETYNMNPALSIKITLLVLGLIDSLESPSHPNITVVGKFEDPQRKGWTQAQVKYTGYATDLFEDFVLLIEKPEEVTDSGDLHNNNGSDSMSLPAKYVQSFLEGFLRFKGNTNVNVPTKKEDTGLSHQTQNETRNTLLSENENIFATEDVNFTPASIDYSIMKTLENSYIASRNTLVNVAKETSDADSVIEENSVLDTNNKIENEGTEKLVVLHSVSNASQERFCTNANSEMLEIPETVPGEDNSSPAAVTDSSLESSQPENTEIKTEEIPEAEISPEVAPDESPSDHSEQDQFLEDFQSFHGKAAEAIEIKKSLDETTTVNANEKKNNELENQDGLIPDIDLKPAVTEECEKDVLNDSGAEIPPAETETSIANSEKDNAEVSEVTATVSSASTQKKINFSQPRMTKLSVCRANLIAKNSAAGISNKETPSAVISSANNETSQPKQKPANVYRKPAAAPLPPKDSYKATAPGVAKTSSYTTSNLKKTTSKSKNVTERPNTAKWRNASLDRKKVTFANANPPKPLVSDKDVSKILINLQTSSGQFELSPILTALVSQDLDNVRKVAKDKGWTESSVGTGLALAFFTGKLSDQKALWSETFDKGKKWLTSHYPKKTDEILEYMAQNIFNE